MEVKLSSNEKKVRKATKKRGKALSKGIKKALSITAQEGINIIQARTSKGVGYKGGKFKPYDQKYAAFRTARNRGTTPDLEFTGEMKGGMTSRANSKRAQIFFTRGEAAKKAAMNNKSRPFFGFSDRETDKLRKIFFRALK
jgi:hypothetical protein